ncbi:LmbE-like protein [Piromyces finnis]|uniref:N-acetylglucosaminylphosphatidylinositol deacetylase n=1 Tax=Piromyces finnis TaxID=1754191 RepID=A0A1Y1VN89_9FUNG|nr:LmbE-like protein [Piromyces finnis]|eukprot:ORX60092.1 LmbE-like protein [Piromyces finnis]
MAMVSALIYFIIIIFKFKTRLIPPPLRLKTEKEYKQDLEIVKEHLGEEAFKNLESVKESTNKQYLIITAHPDDEIMFFAPTIIGLRKQGFKVKILCLSTGNYDKKGEIREVEIKNCVKLLGVTEDNVTVLDHPGLQDNPNQLWYPTAVCKVISEYITPEISAIITFDRMGISGHVNHRSVYEGVKYMINKNGNKAMPAVFTLQTVSIIRKYSSFFDTIFSLNAFLLPHSYSIGDKALFISGLDEIYLAQKAMRQHKSQMVWFRWLYILFSRYMAINELNRINN